jgi:hypothetical protein
MTDKIAGFGEPCGHIVGLEFDEVAVVAFLTFIEQQVKMLARFFVHQAGFERTSALFIGLVAQSAFRTIT